MNQPGKIRKLLKRIVLGILAFILLAVGVIYFWGELILKTKYSAETRSVLQASRPEAVERGKRLSQVFGCYKGCHGADMEGKLFFEKFGVAKLIAPNLTTAVEKFTRSELEAIIRQGIRPDGTSVIAMPSASFSGMTDRDYSAIVAFIEQYPRQDQEWGTSSFGLLARFGLVNGEFTPEAANERIAPIESQELQDPLNLGEYIAMNACSECHGLDLEGIGSFTPSLVIAKGYSLEDFKILMTTGKGVGDRDLGLMSEVAVGRFNQMTDEEVESLHQFLQSR